MFLLLVFALGLTSVNTLTCHCSGSTMCSANGYCSSGCENGWSGPGCQVGNVALNKLASQSTTYAEDRYTGYASLAVDGMVPPPRDTTAEACSHTARNKNSAWWYVTLSTTHDFVITSVTLVNRNDVPSNPISERLRDFAIIYSKETDGNPDPNNPIWNECARQSGTMGSNQTYACKSPAIAKRVAVYLLYSNPILCLCEVKVFGYQLDDCPIGFTGPGCLLRTCDHQCGSTGGTCDGEYGSCRYDVCPDPSLLPPDCWITLSNYSAVQIQPISTCDTVLFSMNMNYSQPNIAASMLLLQVRNSSDGVTVVNVTMPVLSTVFYSYNNVSPGARYNVAVTPIYCNIKNFPCFYSTGSKWFTSVIGKRNYWLSNNQSCFFVHVNSSSAVCELPTAVEIHCKNNYTSKMSANLSSFISCGLEKGHDDECLVTATVNAKTNRFESRTFIPTFVKKPQTETTTETPTETRTEPQTRTLAATQTATLTATQTETLPSENKAGIIAGSIVGVVVVVSIICIAVVCSRRRRSATANEQGSSKVSTIVLSYTTRPSSRSAPHSLEEQHDHFYESLDNRSRLEYARAYADLK